MNQYIVCLFVYLRTINALCIVNHCVALIGGSLGNESIHRLYCFSIVYLLS